MENKNWAIIAYTTPAPVELGAVCLEVLHSPASWVHMLLSLFFNISKLSKMLLQLSKIRIKKPKKAA